MFVYYWPTSQLSYGNNDANISVKEYFKCAICKLKLASLIISNKMFKCDIVFLLYFYCLNKLKAKPIVTIETKDDILLYFNDCMMSALRIIPNDRLNRTLITLGATAGMRLLK